MWDVGGPLAPAAHTVMTNILYSLHHCPCYLLLPCFHGWCHQGMFASLRVYCGGGDIQIILHISGYSSRWEIGNMEQLIHDTDY